MEKQNGAIGQNWFGDITFHPGGVVRPMTEQEIVDIVKDKANYPSPIRGAGSNHSVTGCLVSEPGTAVDMRGMNRILRIGPDTVVAQAGALYIDVAKELEKHGLQFYVHIELGNLSIGAASCSQTKDASFPGEFGTVSSYAIGMKAVLASGEIIEVTEEQPELLQAMRSSYGLLGIIFEVTFRVKPLQALAFHHEEFTLDEFERQLPALIARGESIMYYLYPFHDRVTVEFRRYVDRGQPAHSFSWKVRNYAWATLVPACARAISATFPPDKLRSGLLAMLASSARLTLRFLRSEGSYPADQMIRYPHPRGYARYTFSLWAFPRENFTQSLREYFAFCREWERLHHYRGDLPNVGYLMNQDQSSLLSFTYNCTTMTIDPASSTFSPAWTGFLDACNEFCVARGASPLFNQTPRLTPGQVQKAFGDRIGKFREFMNQYDPEQRLLNRHFAELFGITPVDPNKILL